MKIPAPYTSRSYECFRKVHYKVASLLMDLGIQRVPVLRKLPWLMLWKPGPEKDPEGQPIYVTRFP